MPTERGALRRLKDPIYDSPAPKSIEFYQVPKEPLMIRYHNEFVVMTTWILGWIYFPLFMAVGMGVRGVIMGLLVGAGVGLLMLSDNDRARNSWFNNRKGTHGEEDQA